MNAIDGLPFGVIGIMLQGILENLHHIAGDVIYSSISNKSSE